MRIKITVQNQFLTISLSRYYNMQTGKLCSLIKSKRLDETGVLVQLEAVPVEGDVGDLGHWPPERTLNQTMTAAKSSATLATLFTFTVQIAWACIGNKYLHYGFLKE